ncbi:MAG TPA: hypothetical protein VN457_00290, partial [Chlamydiales bacterium]|nr:hypothetical protein [Chlamydiales bacterium]
LQKSYSFYKLKRRKREVSRIQLEIFAIPSTISEEKDSLKIVRNMLHFNYLFNKSDVRINQ